MENESLFACQKHQPEACRILLQIRLDASALESDFLSPEDAVNTLCAKLLSSAPENTSFKDLCSSFIPHSTLRDSEAEIMKLADGLILFYYLANLVLMCKVAVVADTSATIPNYSIKEIKRNLCFTLPFLNFFIQDDSPVNLSELHNLLMDFIEYYSMLPTVNMTRHALKQIQFG